MKRLLLLQALWEVYILRKFVLSTCNLRQEAVTRLRHNCTITYCDVIWMWPVLITWQLWAVSSVHSDDSCCVSWKLLATVLLTILSLKASAAKPNLSNTQNLSVSSVLSPNQLATATSYELKFLAVSCYFQFFSVKAVCDYLWAQNSSSQL